MQIGSEMATLQEKNPKMDPKKTFFLSKIGWFPSVERVQPSANSQPHHRGALGIDASLIPSAP